MQDNQFSQKKTLSSACNLSRMLEQQALQTRLDKNGIIKRKIQNKNLDIAHALVRALEREREKDFALDAALELTVDLAIGLTFNNHPGLYLALDLIHVLILNRDRDVALARNHEIENLEQSQTLNRNLALKYALDLAQVLIREPRLKNKIQSLGEALPSSNNWNDFYEWWRSHDPQWIEELRSAMIRYRDIAHYPEGQKRQIHRYYNANIFLISLLNTQGVVSEEVRDEIKDKLLLPWSQIEHGQTNGAHKI
ncbi:MAG: hypothetical protein AAGC93_23525, partial [Cyanobacteria bacterium P01_F01_bin.53]